MKEIILHLGAHRTGSTHVQGVMGKNAALLAQAGIGAPPQPLIKAAFTKPLGRRLPMIPGGFSKLMKESGLSGLDTIVISDENLLGFLNNIFAHGLFYPETARRLRRLQQMLPVAPSKVVIAIRPYDSYFASAYGRWISPGRMVLPRATVAELVLGLTRGWSDVLTDVATAFPTAELVISEYSPDRRFAPSQLAAILGPLSHSLVYNPDYRWNRSMSAYQTMLYEKAIAAGDVAKAEDIRTWKRFKQPRLLDEFWEEAARKALQERYEAERARILERFPAFVTAAAFEAQDAG